MQVLQLFISKLFLFWQELAQDIDQFCFLEISSVEGSE